MLIWIVTGLAFNLVNEDYFNANRYRTNIDARITAKSSEIEILNITPVLLQLANESVQSVTLSTLLDDPIIRIKTAAATHSYWGADLSPLRLSEQQITQLAQASYKGPGLISPPQPAAGEAQKYAASPMLLRLDTNDELATSIYIDANTGEVKAHENRGSRLKQLLFMLHFIDYFPSNGLSFNHLAVRTIALLAFILGLSGMTIMLRQIKAGHYRLINNKQSNKQKNQQITLLSPQGETLEHLTLHHLSLLDNLNHKKERIRTQCGGGGQCGMCRIKILNNPPQPTQEELSKLRPQHLEEGIRLSCQHLNISGEVSLISSAQLRHWKMQ
ncbi:2Fe-2S iron-sulfur cluster binding domain-containing protein [Shewanella mesophila]|nr:2Fe-2S iron-sulfur cluster binding domain-containing protein [Shewanella mesophila]